MFAKKKFAEKKIWKKIMPKEIYSLEYMNFTKKQG